MSALKSALLLPWVLNNAKLKATSELSGGALRLAGWGIPADYLLPNGLNTCPGARACRAICYAKQGAYTFRSVVDARKRAVLSALAPSFTDTLTADLQALQRRGYNVVRVHDSGDFYSQSYVDAWKSALAATPGMVAYAYTKSVHLDLWTNKPDSLRLIQSLHGRFDSRAKLSRPHSRIFATHEARESAGYVDGSESDLPAIEGATRIGLVYHGTRKLTGPQETFFS